MKRPLYLDSNPTAEFVNCRGKVTPIWACCEPDRVEFWLRYEHIGEILSEQDQDIHWQTLYGDTTNSAGRQFRHLVDRCLELNGVDMRDVNLMLIEQLLFFRLDAEGNLEPGLLLTINRLANKQTQTNKLGAANADKPLSESAMAQLAMLMEASGSWEDAVGLWHGLPAGKLQEVLAELAVIRSAQADAGKPKKFSKEAKEKLAKVLDETSVIGAPEPETEVSTPESEGGVPTTFEEVAAMLN